MLSVPFHKWAQKNAVGFSDLKAENHTARKNDCAFSLFVVFFLT